MEWVEAESGRWKVGGGEDAARTERWKLKGGPSAGLICTSAEHTLQQSGRAWVCIEGALAVG